MMHDVGNGETFWIELTDLVPGQEYRYQYHIMPDDIGWPTRMPRSFSTNGTTRGFRKAPTPTCRCTQPTTRQGQSVCSPRRSPEFEWTDDDFERPDQENLVIYELLIRDFSRGPLVSIHPRFA